MNTESKSPRREFLGKLAAGAGTTLAIPALFASLEAEASFQPTVPVVEADEWFKKVKGRHRVVYDGAAVNSGFPVAWTFVYYKTNNATGTPDSDMTAVVVLRHGGIALALDDKMWEKYKLGEVFKVTDSNTNAPAVKNIYAATSEPFWTKMGIEGIKGLVARGAMFCVCDVALTVQSGVVAQATNANPEEVKKDWLSGLIPGVQVVPSGVWALGRAQENKCGYIYAGG